jgi:hypothetical protein
MADSNQIYSLESHILALNPVFSLTVVVLIFIHIYTYVLVPTPDIEQYTKLLEAACER